VIVGVVVYVNLCAIASRLLDQFLGITDREKELRARDSAREITADEAEEYRQLQYDRELKRREKIDRDLAVKRLP